MRDSRSANGRIPDPFARDEIDSPRVTDRVYGRHNLSHDVWFSLSAPNSGDGFEFGEPYIFFFDRDLKTSP